MSQIWILFDKYRDGSRGSYGHRYNRGSLDGVHDGHNQDPFSDRLVRRLSAQRRFTHAATLTFNDMCDNPRLESGEADKTDVSMIEQTRKLDPRSYLPCSRNEGTQTLGETCKAVCAERHHRFESPSGVSRPASSLAGSSVALVA